MGVQGLWTVAQPCARPTNLSTLNQKRLAIDASIWIYQFLKAVRDKEGNALRNSHVVGFFRRICKLLWHGVKPVFVFDGGAPALKRATLQGRRRRREGRREDATRTAGKLLAVQMQRMAEEEEEKRKKRANDAAAGEVEEEQEQLPSMDQIVYADELGMSKQERQRNRRFHKKDAYHLPELDNGIEGMGKPNDPRIMSIDELEEYARQFNDGEDINLYDFSKIDFDGEFFKSLPPADRYNILNAARIRSRLRMGLSKDQLDGMFPDRMAFSRFQIERVQERNHLTQRLMYEMGMTGTDLTLAVNRVAGDRTREYILVKNEGAEGGWALGVVSRDKDRGKIHKPIDVDALEFQYQGQNDEDDWEDEDFEDVPIEGLNRLPRVRANETEESLFVENGEPNLFGDDDALQGDEDEDLNRAIALSLQTQHNVDTRDADDGNGDLDEESESAPTPEWEQKAAEAPKPIVSTSGRMAAHIVNNRASAAVPRRRDSGSSDSDIDLQAALAAARAKKPRVQPAKASAPAPAPAKSNVKNPFDGPLPFEKLSWQSAFGGRFAPSSEKPKEHEKPGEAETGDHEAASDEEAGGFEKEPSKDAGENKPRPLPPWLTDDTDIRESVKKQQALEMRMVEEDEEQDDLRFGQDDVIEIESSSDDGSDIEIVDAPPPVEQSTIQEPAVNLLSLEDDVIKETSQIPVRPETFDSNAGTETKSREPSDTEHQEDQDKPVEPTMDEPEDDEMEFEDVIVPAEPEQAAEEPMDAAQISEEARIEAELFGDGTPPPAQQIRTEGLATPREGSPIDPDAPGPEEFEDFSDPEEEELLAQMAEEAEEHARFASQLNNKSQRENQQAYEQELRALRAQQKKDRRDADEVTQVMVTECQALLTLFGIPYITAPMEAEAQCAELVHLNLVDGIVTDDSDTFLFGGTRVYKNMFAGNKYVECYLAKDLETELSLSREQLISLAHLLGSDYTEGLPGVGPVTALEILSEFPGKDGLSEFRDWWQDIQNRGRPKDADAAFPFRRKFRKAHATKLFLPPGFPNPAVADAYLRPDVDSNTEPFQWGVPDLDGLRQFLMNTIGWGQERTDEVLVPVIRDMNKRDVEGTQSNITRFFSGGVGVGAREAFAPRQRGGGGSKRMADAVSRLRARTGGGGGEGLGDVVQMPVAPPPGPGSKGGRKRKARAPAVMDGDGDDEEDGVEGQGAEEEEDEGEGAGISASLQKFPSHAGTKTQVYLYPTYNQHDINIPTTMKTKIATVMLVMAGAVHTAVVPPGYSDSKQLCEGKAVTENGDWYCQKVQSISYENMGREGSYNQVVDMNQETGECKFMPARFSGPLAPFNEPLSLHFRGPLNLKQVAVYMPATRGNIEKVQSKSATDTMAIKARTANVGHQHSAPHLERYYNAFTQGFNNGTRWIPPINDHRHHTHSNHSGVLVSITTGSSSRLENWKLPPTPTPDSVTERNIETRTIPITTVTTVEEVPGTFDNTAAATNTGVAGSVTVTVTVTSYVTGTSLARACSGQGSGSIGMPTPSMTTVVSSMGSPTSTISSGSDSSGAVVSTTPMAITMSSSSTLSKTDSSAPGTGAGTSGQSSNTVSFGTIIPSSALSSRRRCSKTTAFSPSSTSLASSSGSSPSSGFSSTLSGSPVSSSSHSTGSISSSKSYSVVPIYGSSSVSSPIPSSSPGGGNKAHKFVRTGYYNAEQQKAEGVMFLGNYGGQGSGKWTRTFGNTLSYVNADGTGGSPNATILKDTTLVSSQEISLFTNEPCDGSCGYIQNGSVAYKGFAGASKIFLLEFSMPHTTAPPAPGTNTTTSGYDQPAIWLLNARIPYTAQYHTCSCWPTGCGELDLFEVLSPGLNKAMSTVRATYAGGDPNWFERPVDVEKPVRLAVVFDGEGGKGRVEIVVLGWGKGAFPGEVGYGGSGGGEGGLEGLEGLGDGGGSGGVGGGLGSLYRILE
ncbi:putative TOS1-like glycosyl hydrolase-domain-containing protein [Chaetomium tenue]|uniref:TOS1-like glycosyl hydrolase-domain-containing protein n=1 Tax=Chaetomium tenue TaxID=1854479 RepID=A0ACB7PME0_9PEZI|nr:putative TOS1-like glycosyl hydrolase-domain-containing protein [Chaetomium globosum]